MRNTNSSVSKKKTRTLYMTPTDITKSYSSTITGVSTKVAKKKKKAIKESLTKTELDVGLKEHKEKHGFPTVPSFNLTLNKKSKKHLTKKPIPF